jgi:hypothetical protein
LGRSVGYSHVDGCHLLGSLYQRLEEARWSNYRRNGRS